MCLAIPGKLISVLDHEDILFRTGKVSFDGIEKDVNLSLLPEAKAGDYVLVHVGIAISKVDEAEARLMLKYLTDSGDMKNEISS
jgi:hydrogenase expression/formation protein HypC